MPQLDSYWIFSQIFWLAVSFAILYFVMLKTGLPRLNEVMQNRRERIQDDLESAERANQLSEALDEENQAHIRTAKLRAVEIVSEIQKESDAVAAQRHAELDKVLQRKTAEAQASMDAAKKAVLERVVPLSVELTQLVLKRTLGTEIPREKIEQVVSARMRSKHV